MLVSITAVSAYTDHGTLERILQQNPGQAAPTSCTRFLCRQHTTASAHGCRFLPTSASCTPLEPPASDPQHNHGRRAVALLSRIHTVIPSRSGSVGVCRPATQTKFGLHSSSGSRRAFHQVCTVAANYTELPPLKPAQCCWLSTSTVRRSVARQVRTGSRSPGGLTWTPRGWCPSPPGP